MQTTKVRDHLVQNIQWKWTDTTDRITSPTNRVGNGEDMRVLPVADPRWGPAGRSPFQIVAGPKIQPYS